MLDPRRPGARSAKRPNTTAFALLLLFTSCRTVSLPPLPEVSTASFSPAVRQAVQAAVEEAKAHPNDAGSVGRLGMVLHAHQQAGGARACYLRASMLAPANFEWKYYLGIVSDGPAAIEPLRAALRLREYLPAKLRLGEALLSSGDAAGAREVYRGIDHPAALFGYGRAADDAGYYEKALAAFPRYGAAMFALAQHYQRAGRSADAQRWMADYPRWKTTAPPIDDPLLDAVRALDKSPNSLLREASNLEVQGQLAAAADLQLKALELDPKLTQARVNLISLYGRLGDPAMAEKQYRDAIALNPNAQEAYYNFGVLCYQQGRRAEARAAFEKALAIHPGYAEAHNNVGTLLEEDGELDKAAEHFRKAIEIQPSFALARFHLGRIYANLRRDPEAIDQFQRAVEGADNESRPTYLYALGAVQARVGKASAAAVTLASARDQARALNQSALAESIDRDLGRLRR
jgi:Tfp pilus assembly protein PilF